MLDENILPSVTSINDIHRYGNLLLASAGGQGLLIIDIADIDAPRIVYAGNNENVTAAQIYRDRIVAGAGPSGLRIFQLPASLVTKISVPEGGYLALGEGVDVTFNELVTVESLLVDGAIQVFDQATENPVAVTLEALDPTDLEGQTTSATKFRFTFQQNPATSYRLEINDARNQRGTGMLAPFVGRFKTTSIAATQPLITHVESGLIHRGGHDPITIECSGFSENVGGCIDQFEVS